MPRVDLWVPFSEKEQARRLGARWDVAGQVWFVPETLDASAFARTLGRDLKFAVVGCQVDLAPVLHLRGSRSRCIARDPAASESDGWCRCIRYAGSQAAYVEVLKHRW